MNPKDVRTGYAAKASILNGINTAADAIKVTLGVVGKTAIIENDFLSPIVTDDGVTVARSIKFADRHMNMGAEIIKEAASKTNEDAGDGTTQTVVLAQAIINAAMRHLEKDPNSMTVIIEELDAALAEYKNKLPMITSAVRDCDLEKVATIASLDPEVGKIIAEIIQKTGRDGIVSVEDSNKVGLSSEVLVGMKVEAGLMSPYMITNFDKNYAEVPNAAIVVIDRRISMNAQIVPILKSLKDQNISDILLFADDVDGEALATLIINRKGGLNCAVVATRKFGINRGAILTDICTITGATLISEGLGMKLSEATFALAGSCESARITKDYALIVGGKGKKEDIDQRVTQIRFEMDNTNSEVEKEMLRKRLASLAGGVGVIRVGGYTETEVKARRYKIEDAVNATKCAVEEGIVPGGGMAMATLATHLMEGSTLLQEAMLEPFKQMCRNAGVPETTYHGMWPFRRKSHLLVDVMAAGLSAAYDFKTNEIIPDAIEYGLVDPVKVNRLAIENAVSVAKQFITTETVIVDLPARKMEHTDE